MTVRLDDRVVLLTGATAGIGKAVATLCAERGARVVGMARRPLPGKVLADEIAADGGEFTFVAGDVSSGADCGRAVETALERYGRIDAVVNNAATTMPLARVERIADEDWASILDVTLSGTMRMARVAVPVLRAQGDGTIINVASLAAVQGLAHFGAYAAAKAGVVQLTRVLAVENLDAGVRANALVVGSVATDQAAGAGRAMATFVRGPDWTPPQDPKRGGPLAGSRMQPVDAARAIALLCSDDAREITGATIALDRGFSAGWLSSALLHLGSAGYLNDVAPLEDDR